MSANQEKLNEQLLNVVLSDKDSDEAKLKKVKYLVYLGADVNVKNNLGDTALTVAAYNGHLEVVKYLAELGVDLNTKDEYGNTALMMASYSGHKDVVEVLEAHIKKQEKNKVSDNKGFWGRLFGGR